MALENVLIVSATLLTLASVVALITSFRRRDDHRTSASDSTELQELYTDAIAARASSEQMVAELRNRLHELECANQELSGELRNLQSKSVQLETILSSERTLHASVSSRLVTCEQEREICKEHNSALFREKALLEAEVSSTRKLLQQQEEARVVYQREMQDRFEAISNKLLNSTASDFRKNSRDDLEGLLKPFKEALEATRGALFETKGETAKNSDILKQEIARISQEADNLCRVLKGDMKALGTWGEHMLEQILDRSGLQKGIHYNREVSFNGHEGDLRRVDVIVNLPEDRHLIIDSKMSLGNYRQAMNAQSPDERARSVSAHVSDIKNHIKGLKNKHYARLQGVRSPDLVLMYIPVEQAYSVAVQYDSNLFMEALDAKIVLITNSTLLATLHTVAHVWRMAEQERNAQEIAKRGAMLYDKFFGFVEDVRAIGAALDKSHGAWQSAWNKLQTGNGNLIGQAEKLKKLGVVPTKQLSQDLIDEVEDDQGLFVE